MDPKLKRLAIELMANDGIDPSGANEVFWAVGLSGPERDAQMRYWQGKRMTPVRETLVPEVDPSRATGRIRWRGVPSNPDNVGIEPRSWRPNRPDSPGALRRLVRADNDDRALASVAAHAPSPSHVVREIKRARKLAKLRTEGKRTR